MVDRHHSPSHWSRVRQINDRCGDPEDGADADDAGQEVDHVVETSADPVTPQPTGGPSFLLCTENLLMLIPQRRASVLRCYFFPGHAVNHPRSRTLRL
jgi:hypothetical protein